MRKKTLGLIMVLFAGFVFGLMPLLKRGCVEGGANNALLLMSRFFFLSLAVLPLAIKDGGLLRALRENWKPFALLSIVEGATPILLYNAYDHLASGLVMTIHFLYPMIVTACCVLLFRDRLSPFKLLCLILSVVGVFLTVDLSVEGITALGVTLSLLSAVTYAIYIVGLGKAKLTHITNTQVAFFIGVGCFLVALIYSFFVGTPAILPQVTTQGWLWLIDSGIFIAVGGSMCFILGVHIVDSQGAAIASTLEPLTSIVVGVLWMNEVINRRIAIGCVLILVAVVLLPIITAKEEKE